MKSDYKNMQRKSVITSPEKVASEEQVESSEQNLFLETSLEAAISTAVLCESLSTSSLSFHRSSRKKVAPARASSMRKSG